jgi:hypothetical protein
LNRKRKQFITFAKKIEKGVMGSISMPDNTCFVLTPEHPLKIPSFER